MLCYYYYTDMPPADGSELDNFWAPKYIKISSNYQNICIKLNVVLLLLHWHGGLGACYDYHTDFGVWVQLLMQEMLQNIMQINGKPY